jgi:photosystem II stability/assembly factor-like uncharacterized protein
MRKDIVILAMVVLLVFGSRVISSADEISWEDIGRGVLDVKTVLVDANEPRIIYMGSSNGLFKCEDGGLSWRNILSFAGQKKNVNFLLFDPKDKNSLYSATSQGLYRSADAGKNWNRIFTGKNALENECTAIGISASRIYLGTKAGLFVSKDKGRTWHKETGKIGNSPILAISYNIVEPGCIYVACLDGVYKTQNFAETWERIFVARPVENGDNNDQISEDQDEPERFSDIRYLCVEPNNTNYLYIATSSGVYRSKDKGKTWEAMTDHGLLNRDAKFILVCGKSDIYAVTESGVFEYRNERWQELSLGLVSSNIRFLAQDNSGNLYAACDNGLFKTSLKNSLNDTQSNIMSFYGKDEPKINEVQRAAIKYAEVEPEKIKLWRKQAAKKALLPQVSVGIDRNTSDLWHWEGGSTTKTDDDILRRGRDIIDWDVSLTWDLSELIWNDDQTSIDVRSRLMVELRDDILDEVTKIYFERLRVKTELDNLSIEDRKKRFEKELKLQELAAMLDALTGGYFSQQIKKAETLL